MSAVPGVTSLRISERYRGAAEGAVLSAVLLLATLVLRPVYPIDETRYMSVAWEMWLHKDFLVPHLDGQPYTHKPPLLFWLMHVGWLLFGVNDWTPRMVAPLFAIGNLFLTARLARDLWPGATAVGRRAPLVLFGFVYWCTFATLTMFDMLLAFFVLVALGGILTASREGGLKGWGILGAGIGMGILSKGPAALLHVLPAALLAPYWMAAAPPSGWKRWYLGVLGACVFGIALALLWALPAAVAGGEAYRAAIFWGQSAGRLVHSFAHSLPPWWYLELLPVLLLPWLLWPHLWRSLARTEVDSGVRFCLVWAICALGVFSLISGKRPHYLVPEFPAAALLAARALGAGGVRLKGRGHWPIALVPVVGAVVVWSLPLLPPFIEVRDWVKTVSPLWGAVLALVGAVSLVWRPRSVDGAVRGIAVSMFAFFLIVQTGFFHTAGRNYDLRGMSTRLATLIRDGHAVLHFGEYRGEYHFLGRIERPIMATESVRALRAWMQDHPEGFVLIDYRAKDAIDPAWLVFEQPYRGKYVAIVAVKTLLAHPELLAF